MKFKLLLAAFILSCSGVWAQTTVTQQVVASDGSAARGTVFIRITAPCSYAGSYVGNRTVAVPFYPTGSPAVTTFTTALMPNVGTDGTFTGTGACSGTSYTASWQYSDGSTSPLEMWRVPVSSTAVTVDAVKVYTLPVYTTPINPSQISTAGGSFGQAMCIGASGWGPGSCGGSGGGGISGAATWAQIEAGTAGSGDITGNMTWDEIEAGQ